MSKVSISKGVYVAAYIRCTEDLHRRLKTAASRKGLSMQNLTEQYINDGLSRDKRGGHSNEKFDDNPVAGYGKADYSSGLLHIVELLREAEAAVLERLPYAGSPHASEEGIAQQTKQVVSGGRRAISATADKLADIADPTSHGSRRVANGPKDPHGSGQGPKEKSDVGDKKLIA